MKLSQHPNDDIAGGGPCAKGFFSHVCGDGSGAVIMSAWGKPKGLRSHVHTQGLALNLCQPCIVSVIKSISSQLAFACGRSSNTISCTIHVNAEVLQDNKPILYVFVPLV